MKAERIACLVLILCGMIGVWYFGAALMEFAGKLSEHQNAYYTEILNEAVPAGVPEVSPDD